MNHYEQKYFTEVLRNELGSYDLAILQSNLGKHPDSPLMDILINHCNMSPRDIVKSASKLFELRAVYNISECAVSDYIYDIDVDKLSYNNMFLAQDKQKEKHYILITELFSEDSFDTAKIITEKLTDLYHEIDISIAFTTDSVMKELYARYANLVKDVRSGEATAETRDEVKAFINKMLLDAKAKNSSDIHVQPTDKGCNIVFRVDGDAVHYVKKQKEFADRLVRSILSSEYSQIFGKNRLQPRVGIFNTIINSENHELRMNILPAEYGTDINMRFLYKKNFSFDSLGYSKDRERVIKSICNSKSGLVLFVGPVGSGKSTTVYSYLEMVKDDFTICTVEDPVEHKVEGVTQLQVSEHLNYSNAIQSFLRHDPDKIVIGEIRSPQVAKDVIIACETGHLTISTMHCRNCFSAIARLRGLGVSNLDISDNIKLIVCQRLIKTKHQDCNGEGCKICDFKGEFGRTVLSEILVVTKDLRDMIAEGESISAITNKVYGDKSCHYSFIDSFEYLLSRDNIHEKTIDKIKSLISELEG